MRETTIQPGPMNREEKYVICPYNPAHTILQHRMQTHLTKCRKNYPGSDIVICKFDATHHIPRQELEYHHETCISRYTFDKFVYKQDDVPVRPVVELPNTVEVPPCEENWDSSDCQGYDPAANADKKTVLRLLSCAPPAERKAFRREERERIRLLEEEEAAKGPIKDLQPLKSKPMDIEPQKPKPMDIEPPRPKQQNTHNQPLRRPKEPPQAYLNWARGSRMENDFPTVSPGQQAVVTSQAPRIPEWMGIGRGRVDNPPSPPKRNPWGRGQPSF